MTDGGELKDLDAVNHVYALGKTSHDFLGKQIVLSKLNTTLSLIGPAAEKLRMEIYMYLYIWVKYRASMSMLIEKGSVIMFLMCHCC